jgi:hypothetical protein
MLLDEFVSEDKSLKAQIFEIHYVYKVIFFFNDKVTEIKEYRGKSADFVRDVCENYVLGIKTFI